ncbi:BRO-N domain-containing protein [Desmospora activa]|uniref:Prophage antirepressor-like protein n=1 Tax=Desmospora activa DSM 45169 TaxID=1121389 RepID=A0A2T4ZCH4_9BACL|nr:BRO family protein [Desmospora activa]PTM59581.1 prophage antirepressor-like protein [Desmospora activa DSM 45169]
MKTEQWSDHEIRFVEVNGEWWAVAKDVAVALGYSRSRDMVRMLREDQKGAHLMRTPGGEQEVTVISETGIYKAIMRSKRPEAEEFEQWVYKVIKELRYQSGLEGFQVFRMMDKDHQKNAMGVIKETLGIRAEKQHYIKANTVANKAISNKHGHPKMVKKDHMTPEMLKDRQPVLEEAAQLTAIKEAYELDFSVSEAIYKKWNKQKQRKGEES